MHTANPVNPYPATAPSTVNAPDRSRPATLNQMAWVIILLTIIAVCAIIVAYNVIELDVFIHNLQNAFSNLNTNGL